MEETKIETTKLEEKQKSKVGIKRMLFWQSREVSSGVNLLMMGFLTIYCTDTLKVPAALVGILLMVSKIFDGFTDLIAGFIVDKTNTKIGRGRPYEISIIGVWACTWLMFSCPPEWNLVAKGAWILVMYMFVNSIFATFLNANKTVYMVRAFPRQEQYVAINTYGSIVVMVFIIAFNVSFPMLMASMATSAKGWSNLIGIYAVPLALIGLLRFIFIKETNNVDVTTGIKINVKDVITVLQTNHYIYIIALAPLVFNFISNMGIDVYYYTYVVKNIGLLGIIGLTQVVMVPVVIVFPPLIKKYSVPKLMTAGIAAMCVGYTLTFFAYDFFPLLVCAKLFIGIGAVPISMLIPLLIIDCAEFNEWKKCPRLEGTLSSLNGFAMKVGSAFGAGVMGVLLTASGYTGSVETVPGSAVTMIRMLASFIPLAFYILVIIALRFYKLSKLMPEIRTANEETRRAAMGLNG
jgi:probable glucitol transport protein GutA